LFFFLGVKHDDEPDEPKGLSSSLCFSSQVFSGVADDGELGGWRVGRLVVISLDFFPQMQKMTRS